MYVYSPIETVFSDVPHSLEWYDAQLNDALSGLIADFFSRGAAYAQLRVKPYASMASPALLDPYVSGCRRVTTGTYGTKTVCTPITSAQVQSNPAIACRSAVKHGFEGIGGGVGYGLETDWDTSPACAHYNQLTIDRLWGGQIYPILAARVAPGRALAIGMGDELTDLLHIVSAHGTLEVWLMYTVDETTGVVTIQRQRKTEVPSPGIGDVLAPMLGAALLTAIGGAMLAPLGPGAAGGLSAAGTSTLTQVAATGTVDPLQVAVSAGAGGIAPIATPAVSSGIVDAVGVPLSVGQAVATGTVAAGISAGAQAALTGEVNPTNVAIAAGSAAAGSAATSVISSLSSPAPLPTSSDMSVTRTSPADTMIADSTKGGATPMLGQDDSGVIPTPTDYVPDASVMAEAAASYQERLGADYVASTQADLQGSLGQAIVTDTSANLPAAQAAAGVGDTSGLWGSAIGSALKTLATGLLRDVSGVIKTSTGGPGSALPGSHPVVATGAQAPAAGTVVLPVIGAVPGWAAIAGVGMIAYLMMRR